MQFSKIITLGPKGTFSNLAASKVDLQGQREIIYTQTIPKITKKVEESDDSIGVIPIENSIAGCVGIAQDAISESNIEIINELSIPVQISFVSKCKLNEVKRYYAHPATFNQISKFITENTPNAEVIYSDSNIHSGELFIRNSDPYTAAVIPKAYAMEHEEYAKFHIIQEIQDYVNNTTRFFVIKKRKQDEIFDFNKKKCSLMVMFLEDRHSLLFEMLREFHVFDINLSYLQSRPSKGKKWGYVFFIDFYNNHRTEKCFETIKSLNIRFKLLGSYDTSLS